MARRSATNAAVETADNILDVEVPDAEAEEVVEEVATKKTVVKERQLDKDDVIKVVSLIHNVSYKDTKYGDMYRWENSGDVVEMTFEAITYMWQNHKTYFKSMWLKPLDERVVKKFGLEHTYRDYDYLMESSNYTRENVKTICESICATPQSLKFAICNKIKSLVSSGEVADVIVLREIEKKLNIDLIPLIS